jgi:DNA-binding CsgD family transcriptional regulator
VSMQRLTPRQQDVLSRVAKGHTNDRIARDLSVSVDTVRTHMAMILDRLGAVNRAQAVAVAIRAGEIP